MSLMTPPRLTLPRVTLPRPGTARGDAFGQILLNELRLTRRRPVAAVVGLGLPVLLAVIYGKVPAFHVAQPSLGGLTLFDAYEPVLVVFGLAALALWGLPSPLVSYRELGILRRLSTTPVPPSWLLAAQALVQLGVAVLGIVLILTLSVTAFGARAPASLGGVVAACALAIAGMFPLGLLIAAMSRTSGGASVIGRLLFFPLMFLAGLWLPRALMPVPLQDISNYSPLGAATQAIQDSMLKGFPPVAPLLVLAGYAIVLSYLARRWFRWE
jgi:ABC-2 type transport system permease protein